ncbi:hypothetical protein F511_25974 [Dorcoceras hygrometricum]|uniref:Uncharacterized protein n=1 Tax=Dorcoceras hygrometricum TaxID=472368 RepID=A0A2Z7AGQ4_9LAMI|nr:hypothetical protein F511_25974 [Dorcoceras hygrometricum]
MSTSNPMLDPNSQLIPPMQTTQQAYTARSSRGPVGPVIGVLAMITILGAIAVMIGRLCSGRKVMGHLQYDIEGWVEAKCASCIDGRVEPTPPRLVVEHRISGEPPGTAAPPPPQERDEESRRGEKVGENSKGRAHE